MLRRPAGTIIGTCNHSNISAAHAALLAATGHSQPFAAASFPHESRMVLIAQFLLQNSALAVRKTSDCNVRHHQGTRATRSCTILLGPLRTIFSVGVHPIPDSVDDSDVTRKCSMLSYPFHVSPTGTSDDAVSKPMVTTSHSLPPKKI